MAKIVLLGLVLSRFGGDVTRGEEGLVLRLGEFRRACVAVQVHGRF